MYKRFWLSIAAILLLGSWLPSLAADRQVAPIQVLFMHHSTGQGLIDGGDVRETFTTLGYEFWDHGYNEQGVADPSGHYLGVSWNVPGDNTDPDGWYHIFNQPVTDPPANVFSHMLQADVIAFKSCFPSSNIYDDAMLETYRDYYLGIRDVMDRHPDKLFIPFTPPPLVPNETTPENAARAQRWADYLTSAEYLEGHPNVVVFDFFNLLADENGHLRAAYRADEWDSHPNDLANRTIGPLFVEFVDQAVQAFEPGASSTAPTSPLSTGEQSVTTVADAESPEPVPDPPAAEVFSTAQLFDGFEDETALEWWWTYQDAGVTLFTCELDEMAHQGTYSLQLRLDIPAGAGAGCGTDIVSDPAWSDAQGISFYWRADTPNLIMRFALGVADPAQPGSETVPFEIELTDPGEAWAQITVYWDDLARVEWIGDQGAQVFDPAHVVSVIWDTGHWERKQAGTIWIDGVTLFP